MSRSPRLARGLLRRLLPTEIAESLIGDLEELHGRRARRHGRLRADLWYWWQVATLPYARLRGIARRLRGRHTRASGTGREAGDMGQVIGRAVLELKVAARTLARRPLFSGIVIATLAASLGAVTLLFSVLEGVLLRPLPYADPGGLVNVHATNEAWRTSENPMIRHSWDSYGTSLEQVEALAQSGVLAALGASSGDMALVRAGGPPEEIRIERMTAGAFEALGVEPRLGRLPSADEHEEGARVVVVSHVLWTGRLGADPDALARPLELEGDPHTVIGVMPPGFHYPYENVQAWTPLTADILGEGRRWALLEAIGRLGPGVDPSEAQEELAAVNRRLAEGDPEMEGIGIRVVSHMEEVVGNVRSGLVLLSGTVALVLLLACVNLANLVVARSARRRGEMAVRASLGAGRGSLLWAISAEVLLLCMVGGSIGAALAVGLLEPFVAALEGSVRTFPRTAGIAMNPLVLSFAAGMTLVTAFGAALPVGLAAARRAPGTTLRSHGRGDGMSNARRTQRLLLLAETALAVLLLAGAGLLSRSFARAMAVDPGYRTGGLLYADMDPGSDRPDLDAYYERLRERLAALPGVQSATVASDAPSSGGAVLNLLRPTDRPENEGALVSYSLVGPGYFQTLGLPLLRGRGFRESDTRDATAVTVLSRAAAGRLFGEEEDPLGRSVSIGQGENTTEMEVVGIVGEARITSVRREAEPHFYRPLAQRSTWSRTVLLLVAGDPLPVLEAVRRVATEVDPDVLVEEVGTVEQAIARSLSDIRFRTVLMGALAGLALALALVGVFGVVAHVVEEQNREIGIRMALGSRTAAEIRRVMRGIATPVVVGAALGTAVAWRASGLMDGLVEEELLADPMSYGIAPLVLAATALLAAWLPALQAARVHPAEVLDGE